MEAFPRRVRENTLDWEVARKQVMLREASLWSSVLQVEECIEGRSGGQSNCAF